MYLESLRALEDTGSNPSEVLMSPVMLPPDSGVPIPYQGIRGISKKVLEELEVFYCNRGKYRGRLIFPVKDVLGHLLGFDARIYTPPGEPIIEPTNPKAKYLRPSSFKTSGIVYGTYKSGYADTIILTEGVFDALSWRELGYPAVCNFGLLAMTPEKAGMIAATGATRILNGFDLDTPGVNGWQNIKDSVRKYFGIAKPSNIMKEFQQSGYKDANDFLIHCKT
jgi:DNA primase